MGRPSKASDRRADEAFAWMEEMWPQVDARLAEFAAELRRAVKDARARTRLTALFEKLARSLCVEREEAARLWYESGSYEASRRAGDRALAAHRAGESEDARLRKKRDKDIEDYIRKRHAENVWGKQLVMVDDKKKGSGELVDRWGIETKKKKLLKVDKEYTLSTAVLRKRESRIRTKRKKAPGLE